MRFKDLLFQHRVGNIITLGKYPCDASGEMRPIRWRVMEVTDEAVTIMTDEVIEARPFDMESAGRAWRPEDLPGMADELMEERHFRTDAKGQMWRQTDLCRWLNGEFIRTAFSDQERKQILPDVNGMVRIPTPDEFISWFRDEKASGLFYPSAVAQITPHAQAGLDMNAPCWWLRGGDGNVYAYICSPVGSIGMSRVSADNRQGVRPMMRLRR